MNSESFYSVRFKMHQVRKLSKLVIVTVLFALIVYSQFPALASGMRLGTSTDSATQLGITGNFSEKGKGVSVPNSAKPYYFRFLAEDKAKFKFKLTSYPVLQTVGLGLELFDSSGKKSLAKDSKSCVTVYSLSGKCEISLDSKSLKAGYYFLSVSFTPPGLYDQAVPDTAWLTWDPSGAKKSRAITYIGSTLNGFMEKSAKEHWYKLVDLVPNQKARLTLVADKNSDLDVFIYDSDENLIGSSELGKGKYPESVNFSIKTSTVYIKVVNTGKTSTEYETVIKATR